MWEKPRSRRRAQEAQEAQEVRTRRGQQDEAAPALIDTQDCTRRTLSRVGLSDLYRSRDMAILVSWWPLCPRPFVPALDAAPVTGHPTWRQALRWGIYVETDAR
ncbi:unnamed protein product [Diplocarpon coronariae]|nr:hypothetical protein JHW43_000258 [Diplocarpon mali]